MTSITKGLYSGFSWAAGLVSGSKKETKPPVQDATSGVAKAQLVDRPAPILRPMARSKEYDLMRAASLGDTLAIVTLQKEGVNLESTDPKGATALHYAAALGQKDVIDLLWYYGCNLDVRDNNGTPIDENCSSEIKNYIHALRGKRNRFDLQYPLYNFYSPENLVFKGGGPKGIAYVGALRYLEAENRLSQVKRVAGTSAGAITAALLSVGYTSKDLEDLLNRTDLVDLLDHPLSEAQKIVKKAIAHPLESLSDLYHTPMRDKFRVAKRTAGAVLSTAVAVVKAPFTGKGLCEGEHFRNWFENLLEESTGIKHCTFGELKKLAETDDRFKQLYVYTTNVDAAKRVICVNSEDAEWQDVIISDAVRASMSIPGVFKPHELHTKDASGRRVLATHHGVHWDGGILANFPIDAFDQVRFRATNPNGSTKKDSNMQTLGFNLVDPQIIKQKKEREASTSPERTPFGLGLRALEIIREAEDATLKRDPINAFRTIDIDNQGIGLVSGFFASWNQKNALIQSGYASCAEFFDHQNQLSLASQNERPPESIVRLLY